MVVVVSAALKIQEHSVLRGKAHLEETHQCLIFIHKPHAQSSQIDMFAAMHAFNEMHGDVCTLAGMHRHSEHQL